MITKEVVSDKAKVTKSSNGQNIQYNDTDIKCTLCCNKYKTKKMLQRHMNTKHDVENVCDLCNARFRRAEELVNHKLSLHTEDTQGCKLCGFKNTTYIKMRAHMVSKHSFEICHLCEDTSSNAEQHKKHFEQNHVDPENQDLIALFNRCLEDEEI